MALGTKRTCGTCNAKFYDLEKTPILCPKCGTEYSEVSVKTKSRKSKRLDDADENLIGDLEIDIEDVADLGDIDDIEVIEDEDTQIEELDDDIRESMEMEDDEEIVRDKAASDDVMLDLEGDSDDMIDSGDEEDEEKDKD